MSGAQDAVDEQTVFVENLPFDCTHEKLEAAFGDIGPVRECYVVGVPCRGVGFVKYALPTDARAAVELMAGRLVGGRKVRVSLSKQKGAAKRDRAAREPGGAPPAGGGGGARGGRGAAAAAPEGPRGRSRLIVRNLAWKVDEPALKALFSAHGRVVDVAIPRNADGRGRGFAFVEMSSAEESGDALKSLNLASLQGRPIAVDYAVAKDRYDGANAAPGADADAAAPPAAPVAPAAVVAAPAARGAGKATGKPAAVAQAAPTTDVSSDSTDSTSDEQDSDSEQQDSASEQQDSEPDSDGDEPDSADEDDDADSEPAAPPPAKAAAPAKPAAKLAAAPAAPAAPAAKPAAPAAKPAAPAKPKPAERASGTADGAANAKPARASKQNPAATVFVQNLSFDSTADELRDALSGAHGKVTSALLVTDGVTGLPRGSAFVNFASEAAAAAACAQSAAAAFGAEGEGTWLRGRQLRVLPAVDRTRASSLTEENAKQRLADKKESDSTHGKHADLASLGVIFANSDAAVGLPPAEVRKHEQDWAKKKAKLKSPHFVVCPTRLSVTRRPHVRSPRPLCARVSVEFARRRLGSAHASACARRAPHARTASAHVRRVAHLSSMSLRRPLLLPSFLPRSVASPSASVRRRCATCRGRSTRFRWASSF
jgi:nucleolar protein 4